MSEINLDELETAVRRDGQAILDMDEALALIARVRLAEARLQSRMRSPDDADGDPACDVHYPAPDVFTGTRK